MGLLQKQFQDEAAAREYLERLFWPDGPVCPKCGVIGESTKLQPKQDELSDPKTGKKGKTYKAHARKGVYQCNGCREQFTVTIGTIFEDSHIPLHKWLLAFHLMCSSKKGISALQLQRELFGENEETGKPNGSYRTAWFMCHRIRWVMTQSPMKEALLSGVVEADETYIGGKEKGKGRGRGKAQLTKKTPVLALVERGGRVRSFPLERATLNNIKPIIKKHVDPSTHLVTDEYPVYYQLRGDVAKHSEIAHKDKKYVRRDGEFVVTANTVESYFSLMKRSNYGTYHHWSRKYLPQYCAEIDFRYNGRKMTDDQRTTTALKASEGKRLMLKEPKGTE